MDNPKFYLTTPIYYANSRPHVGSAYTTIVCDVIARYKRMCGYDVAYLTGTDEHGVNIERAAEAQGITPQQLVDKNEKIFRELWKLLEITTTDFIRTTSPEHARAVQTLVWRTLDRDKQLPQGERSIYKGKYEGRYCIYDNLFVSDTPDPIPCPTCGRPTELVSEENYFFRLSKYQQALLDFYEKNPKFVEPEFRFNEVRSLVQSGLKDVSISRKTIQWGIPWPGDPEHVFYVWYDALTSYMSGIGYASENPAEEKKFEHFWPADLHMIGKEIIRFHAVYWPAFLMAADLPLPRKIFAHGWLLFEQEKMSKSKGNIAYPEPIVKAFDELTGAKVGNDALRYYLLRETVFGQDGNFSREALITRYNADLANGLGNLASRVLTMIHRYCDGRVPEYSTKFDNSTGRQWYGPAASESRRRFAVDICSAYENFEFSKAAERIWEIVAHFEYGDGFLAKHKPWTHAENPDMRWFVDGILHIAVQTLWAVTVFAHPIIPETTRRIWKQLGMETEIAEQRMNQVNFSGLKAGTKIGKPEAVFPRIDKKEATERIEAMENEIRNPENAQTTTKTPAAVAGAAAGATPLASSATAASAGGPSPAPAANSKITIEDFAKVELRVGEIKSAERIQGADRLLKLLVDIGDEMRQVLAGIALAYAPEELIGRKVVIVANLAPRKMRGLESNGMLLAASVGADGKPVLCTFAEDIVPGAKVK